MNSTIVAVGHYNSMIGRFSNYGNIPAFGLSIGVERIATILEQTMFFDDDIPQVYIATIGANMIIPRVKLCSELRRFGLQVQISHLANPKMRSQFDEVFSQNIPLMIIIGENELKTNLKSKTFHKRQRLHIQKKKLSTSY